MGSGTSTRGGRGSGGGAGGSATGVKVSSGVVVSISDRELATLSQRVGKTLTRDDVAAMAGAVLPGMVVSANSDVINVTGRTPGGYDVNMTRAIRYGPVPGEHSMYNSYFSLRDSRSLAQIDAFGPKGPPSSNEGLTIFSSQVKALTNLGFKEIGVTAAGRAGEWAAARQSNPGKSDAYIAKKEGLFNGFGTWARYGYSGLVSPGIASRAMAVLPGLRGANPNNMNIQKLITSEGGPAFWRSEGHGFSGKFDLRKGSTAHQILATVVRSKKKRKPS